MLKLLEVILSSILASHSAAKALYHTANNSQWASAFHETCPDWSSDDNQDGGLTSWQDAILAAEQFVAQLNTSEKISLTLGSSTTHGCSGFTAAIPRLNFSGICLNDGPEGAKAKTLINSFSAQLSIGASWNRSLAGERGRYIGRSFKAKGINVGLGPVVGPLGRVATGGRNWEGFSNDPYLAGALVGPTIEGMQESVVACVKHYILNEQETNRNPYSLGLTGGGLNQSVSSNVDDRTLHELYLWPFYDAVKAQVGSVMCSYNKINGTYACQNNATLNTLLKGELGFKGFVVSDWFAVQGGLETNEAGTDMIMPLPIFESADGILAAINNGTFDEMRLNDQVIRIMAAYYKYADFYSGGVDGNLAVDSREQSAESTLLQSAIEGHVLVKNVNNTLPFNTLPALNVFGYDAIGGINTTVPADAAFDVIIAQTYTNGLNFTLEISNSFLLSTNASKHAGPEVALNGTLLSGGGSGFTLPTSSIPPFDAIVQRAAAHGTVLHYDVVSTSPIVLAPNDPCLVFINAFASESWDRSGLYDDYSDKLILNVATQCPNTIVIIHNAGIRVVDAWIEHPNIKAVLYAHTPGQFSGPALVNILYGEQSPSGRLPYTVGKQESDYGSLLYPTWESPAEPYESQSNFTEGLDIDYKHFIANGIEPRFAFGYGLTYTNFDYLTMSIERCSCAYERLPPNAGAVGTIAPEGSWGSLYDVLASVIVHVKNVGNVAAAEVAQLYVSIPGSGQPKVLRGFDKRLIQPGERVEFAFSLRRRDLSIWNVQLQQWELPSGTFDVFVGKSVADMQLHDELFIETFEV